MIDNTAERIEQDKKNHTYKHFKLYFTNGEFLLWNDCEVRFILDSIVIYSKNGDIHSFILNNIAGYGYNKGE